MKTKKRLAAVVMATATLLVPLTLGASTPAYADRCEPEELVLGAGTSPIDERDSPVCYVLLNYTYGFICNDFTTLNTCLQSRDPDPNYRPSIVFYQPDPNRIYCNLFLFVFPNGQCSYAGE